MASKRCVGLVMEYKNKGSATQFDHKFTCFSRFTPMVLEVFSRAPYSQPGQPADDVSRAKQKIGDSEYIQGAR